ncbi:hypothetical protein Tco_1352736 [Tanacetum coccineum]
MMMSSKSYERHPTHKALYDALLESIFVDENDMDRLAVDPTSQRKRRHEDKDEDPSAGSDQRKKKRKQGDKSESLKKSSTYKESSKGKTPPKTSMTGKSIHAEETVEEDTHEMAIDVEEPTQDNAEKNADQPQNKDVPKTSKIPNKDWFKQPPRPPTPDPGWNTFLTIIYNLLKGTCQSSIELEYNMEESYKAMTDRLDWENPEGDRCPFDLSKPHPLKGYLSHLTIATQYFFNSDPEYLKLGSEERKYTKSITKTKAIKYNLKFIEDMIPNQWSPIKVGYNKDVAFRITHLGYRRKLWYRSQINKFSPYDVYSTLRILSVASVQVEKVHGYGYLKEIVMRRADRKLYKLKQGDFPHLHLNDIKDMLLLQVQHKLFNLEGSDIVDLAVALRMFTRRIIIHKCVKDVQLGVESYQKKLNLTKPQKYFPTISTKEPYTPSFNPPRVFYEDSSNWKRLMRAGELYKFSDGTLMLMINELLWERRVMQNLERLVGARELEMDYRLMQRIV